MLFGDSFSVCNSNLINFHESLFKNWLEFLDIQYFYGINVFCFKAYDFGATENVYRYNTTVPPMYDLSKVDSYSMSRK